MAPKRAATAEPAGRKVAPRRGAAPATVTAGTTPAPSLASNVNSKMWAELAENIVVVTGHSELGAIREAEALGITGTDESGTQALLGFQI